MSGWNAVCLLPPQDYYYESKFGWGPDQLDERRKLVEEYITGLYWVLEYYHNGVQSWDWYFPYLYAPLASDLVNLASVNSTFTRGAPFTPLMQLLSVLPAQSGGISLSLSLCLDFLHLIFYNILIASLPIPCPHLVCVCVCWGDGVIAVVHNALAQACCLNHTAI